VAWYLLSSNEYRGRKKTGGGQGAENARCKAVLAKHKDGTRFDSYLSRAIQTQQNQKKKKKKREKKEIKTNKITKIKVNDLGGEGEDM